MTRRELIRNRGLLGLLARDPVTLGAAGPELDAEGFVPVILALVAVQTVAALAFAAAGPRERARVGQAVPA